MFGRKKHKKDYTELATNLQNISKGLECLNETIIDKSTGVSEKSKEEKYKISNILDDWKKIVGFYIACITVCSAFNIVIWSLLSSGFNIKVSAYLLSHGMGGGAVSFQPIVIMQTLFISAFIIFFTGKNILRIPSLERPVKIFFLFIAYTLATALLIVALTLHFDVFYTPIYPKWVLKISILFSIILIPVALFIIKITTSTVDEIKDSVENAKQYPVSATIGISICIMIIILSGLVTPVSMYYTGYGTECFNISKDSVSDRVLESISENHLTNGQKTAIRESLEESWSVRGAEGERFYIFVTREDRDTIDGVLFKRFVETKDENGQVVKEWLEERSNGKIITINRKAIKTRSSQFCLSQT